jgi:cytochrome b561
MNSTDNTFPTSYTPVAKAIHAITALLVLLNIAWGLHMEHFPGFKHGQPEWNDLLFVHASIGALIFWLTLVRFVWRVGHQPPQEPSSMPNWQKVISKIVHGIFYILLLALPLSGYVHRLSGNHAVSFWGLFNWPPLLEPNESLRLLTDKIHVGLACLLIALLALHLGAVIKHTVMDRDGILKRMF